MRITLSNVLKGVVPSVKVGASLDLAQNLTDPDFSTTYESSSVNEISIFFGATQLISSASIAGVNIASGVATGTFSVYDGSEFVASTVINRNHCVSVFFPSRTFTNLNFKVTSSGAAINPIITYCAAGSSFVVPNSGETSGYNRQFLARNYQQKITTNQFAAPVSILRRPKLARGKLTLPNMLKSFTENEWQFFLDFATDNYFFITEQENEEETNVNNTTYMCYNLTSNSVTAHQQTRALNNVSIGFDVYNGL
jgi:hypothetical protein